MPEIRNSKPVYALEERTYQFAKNELKKIFSSIPEKSKRFINSACLESFGHWILGFGIYL